MFWSLELYVNAAEAYASQDWKLQTPQKKSPKHLKKIVNPKYKECAHEDTYLCGRDHTKII